MAALHKPSKKKIVVISQVSTWLCNDLDHFSLEIQSSTPCSTRKCFPPTFFHPPKKNPWKSVQKTTRFNQFDSNHPGKTHTWMETKRLASLRLAGTSGPLGPTPNPQVHQRDEAKPWRHRPRFTKTLWSPPEGVPSPGKAESFWRVEVSKNRLLFLGIETSLAWIPR